MTITLEEKAKAYDEAINKIKPLYEQAKRDGNPIWSTYEYLFPELRESEDKRIIQFFAELATDACGGPGQEYYEELGLNYDRVMAWLEKQKEEKHATIEQVYEKFLSSDTLKSAKENKYIRAQVLWELMHNGIITEVDYQYLTDDKRKPWTAEEYCIAYQKGFEMSEQLKQKEQNKCPEFCSGHCVGCERNEQKPVLAPERIRPKFAVGDTVCRPMWSDHTIREIYIRCNDPVYVCVNEEGTESHILISEQDEWERKKQKPVDYCSVRDEFDLDGNLKQKPVEWSEEDEEMRNLLIAILEVNHPNGFFKANELGDNNMRGVHVEELIAWLKSLHSNLKKKNEDAAKLCSNEWSEEDEEMLDAMIDMVSNSLYEPLCPRERMLTWLDEFRTRLLEEDTLNDLEEATSKCKGCNNVKGCVTCVNGDQWAHYEKYEKSEKPII